MRAYLKANRDTDATRLARQAKAFDKAIRPFFPHLEHFASLPFSALFITPDQQHHKKRIFSRAQTILEQHGFLLPSTADSECVDMMHQLIQRAVREHLMSPDTPDIPWSWTKGVLDTVEAALKAHTWFEGNDPYSDPSTLPRLRRMRPAVEHWCKLLCDPSTSHLCGYQEGAHDLLSTMGDILYADLACTECADVMSTVLLFRKRVLAPDNPKIFNAMESLARTYYRLKRLNDAKIMQEDVLKFRKRNFPDHPSIGIAMTHLAITYQGLKHLDKAVKLKEDVLDLYKRVHPRGHPDIGVAMSKLAITYKKLKRLDEAAKLQEDALDVCKQVLHSDHPGIALSMYSLANTYEKLNRLDDAVRLGNEALDFRKRVLPRDHPNIVNSMCNLANTYKQLGQFQEALALMEEVLKQLSDSADHSKINHARNMVAKYRSDVKNGTRLKE